MFRALYLSILCMAVVACSHGQKTTDKERAYLHYKIGSGHLAKGNYPQALKELMHASRLDPSSAQIQNNLGLAYLVREKYTKAAHHMRRATRLDPSYTDARNNLGRVLIESGLYKEAVKELRVAAQDLTYGFPHKVWANLGLAQYRQSKFKSAKKSFKKSLALDRKNCITYNWYSRTLFELKQFNQAATSYDQTIELCKKRKMDEPHYYGALSYQKIGRKDEAVARLEEVIQIYPNGRFVKKAKTLLKTMNR